MGKPSADWRPPEEPEATQPESSRNRNNKHMYILYIILLSVLYQTTSYTNSHTNSTAPTPGMNEEEADLLRSPMTTVTELKETQQRHFTVLYDTKCGL